jgi:hypothetical protein
MDCCNNKIDDMDVEEKDIYPTIDDKKLIEQLWQMIDSIIGKYGHIVDAWRNVVEHFEKQYNCVVKTPENVQRINNRNARNEIDVIILKLKIMTEKLNSVVFTHTVNVFVIKYYAFCIL